LNATAVPPKLCPTCGTRYAADALFCPNDGTPLSSAGSISEGRISEAPDLYLGREISGHIEIRQLAGIGAMGRVYRAFQKGIERDVAVKILHRELSANPQLVARFHREAKVASRLSHPNVVQVHLAGQLPDGALFIVMEYLDGLSLQSALAAAGGYMPLPRALHIALQICDAAGEAHSEGVVHRDLKPENVMLIRRGDDVDYVKVLDFGIARLNWSDQSMATAAGLIFGTARYISPEGAQGEAVGPQGDVYAIATLLYQMLGGRTPFEGDQAVALLVQQIHDPAPPLKSLPRAAQVPDPIAAVVMKNLVKRAHDRAPDARVLGRMLMDAAKASGLSPEELVPRSVLLGSKPGSMQLPPVQRTKQLDLPAELAARLAGPPREAGRAAATSGPPMAVPPGHAGTVRLDAASAPKIPPTVGMAAMTGTSPIAVPPTPAPGAATTKLNPPPDLAARLTGKPKEAISAKAPRKRVDSNVEETMDDDDAPPEGAASPGADKPAVENPAARPASSPLQSGNTPVFPPQAPAGAPPAVPRTRTEFGEPVFVAAPSPMVPQLGAMPIAALASPEPARVPSGPSAPSIAASGTALPTSPGSGARVPTTPPSKPASSVETTLSDEENALPAGARTADEGAFDPSEPRRARSRIAVIGIVCFLLSAIVAAAVLYRIGLLGPAAQANTLDARVARADEAMRHKRWDTPPGENVRDLTDDGLARWPRDARLLDIRERAADELVIEALGRKFEGDLPEALHLAKLANQLDPTDTTAQHLVEEYEQEDKPPPVTTPPLASLDAGAAPPHASGAHAGNPPPPVQAGGTRVTIDALPPRPRLGQPVAFSAKVATAGGAAPKVTEDVHFKINGPGLSPDTRLTAIPDAPGAYRTTFTFFEAGRYELTFEARVDGVLTRTQRQVIAGDDTPAGAGTQPLPPPPAPSGKWL
jgi:serine/threonine protein kinase